MTSEGVEGKHQFVQLLATQFCRVGKSCTDFVASALGNRCEAFVRDQYTLSDSEALVLDTELANLCLRDVSGAQGCDELFAAATSQPCRQALQGTLRVGSPCVGTGCAAGASCDESRGCPGECRQHETPPLQLGAPCDSVGAVCESWLTCDDVTRTCRKPGDIFRQTDRGGPCSSLVACKAGLYCALEVDIPGICQPLHAAGAPCRSLGCPEDYYCDNYGDNPTDTCVPKLPDGASCDDSYDCSGGFCAGDRCAPARLLGDACAAHQECFSGYCDGSSCGRPPQCFVP